MRTNARLTKLKIRRKGKGRGERGEKEKGRLRLPQSILDEQFSVTK